MHRHKTAPVHRQRFPVPAARHQMQRRLVFLPLAGIEIERILRETGRIYNTEERRVWDRLFMLAYAPWPYTVPIRRLTDIIKARPDVCPGYKVIGNNRKPGGSCPLSPGYIRCVICRI